MKTLEQFLQEKAEIVGSHIDDYVDEMKYEEGMEFHLSDYFTDTLRISREICEDELEFVDEVKSYIESEVLSRLRSKSTDTRSVTWNGLGQVELDAVRPEKLQELIKGAVDDIFDEELFSELKEREWEERKDYRLVLKEFVKTL